jgi:4-hydroxy-tetrahydrodipicolinate synthase
MLISGEVNMIPTWVSRPQAAGAPVEIIWNQGIWGGDSWSILAGTPNADACREFIKFTSDPKRQAALVEYFPAGLTQPEAFNYEIPYRTRIAIDPTVLHELSRHPNIIGMKACNLDMYHFLKVMAGVDEDFAVLSGEDTLFPLHVAAGARGGIIVTANLLPRAWRQIFEVASSGETAKALEMHRRLIPLMNMAFAETNPGPMKAVMDLIGVHAPLTLIPLIPPAEPLETSLRAELLRQLSISETA